MTNCKTGWLRARLPDNSEFTKYFTSSNVAFNSGTKTGAAAGYVSCSDDGKEYSVSFVVKENTISNQKDLSMYTDKTAFLISDKNWQNVLSLVPIAVWTNSDGGVAKHPLLIYHEENYYIPFIDIDYSKINEFSPVLNGDWQSFVAGENYISRITLYPGAWASNPNAKFVVALKDSSGKIIATSNKIIANDENSIEFNVPVIKNQTYKLVFTVENGPLYIGANSNNPYPNGQYSEDPSSDIAMKIYGNSVATSFDADSIIYFMQQYKPDKVVVVGNTSQELDNLLIVAPELGAGLNNNQILRIFPENYTFYWNYVGSVVVVDYNNYEAGLMASTFASYINAPVLFVNATNLNSYKDLINGRKVYAIDNLDSSVASYVNSNAKGVVSYSLADLQKEYLRLTNTDKIILLNPNDLSDKAISSFKPDKSANPVSELYGKISLAAPILASAKHEVIITTKANDEKTVKNVFKTFANGYNIKYLTIAATPTQIQMIRQVPDDYFYQQYGRNSTLSVDASYGDVNDDYYSEVAVGRVFSVTLSDVSSYIGRDIFYQETATSSNNALFIGNSFGSMEKEAYIFNKTFASLGYSASTYIAFPSATANDWRNKGLIVYEDHGTTEWAGIVSSEMPYLDNSFVIGDACLTCGFDKDSSAFLFCADVLRKGGIGYIGSVEIDGGVPTKDIVAHIYSNGMSIGDSFKETMNGIITMSLAKNWEPPEWMPNYFYTFIGDPTLKLSIPNKIPSTNMQLLEDNNEKTVYKMEVQNKYIKYNETIFHPEWNDSCSQNATIVFSSIDNLLNIPQGCTSPSYGYYLDYMAAEIVFNVGPFDLSTQYYNVTFNTVGLQSCWYGTEYYTEPGTWAFVPYKLIQKHIENNKAYFWIDMYCWFNNTSSFVYDDNFHTMEINATLMKGGG